MLRSPVDRPVRRWLPGALVGLLAVLLSSALTVPGAGASEPDEQPPETQISGGPRDDITPNQPVILTKQTTVRLTASEPATFNCAINARKVPCQAGVTVLSRFKPGPQVFVAQAVDEAGNFDATPATLTFYVPRNFKAGQGKGWKKVKSRVSYAGDYVSTSKKGAVLTIGKAKGVREVRLMAPAGPRLGTLAVRIGTGSWMKVRLKSPTSQRLTSFELRGAGAHPLSGLIQVKALKVPARGAVAVDAIVAR